MKYERLTDKNRDWFEFTEINDIEIYRRLQELENKIENETLIELGYHIQKSYRNHDDQRYKIILIDEVKIDKIGYDCLTKAEAEKKLKELKGE